MKLSLWTTRRRAVLHLLAVGVVLLALIPRAQPAHAQTGITNPGCSVTSPSYGTWACSPPALLSLLGLYSATPAQASALQDLETQAISNTLTDHGLPVSDQNVVQSWARSDAEAELFGLLVQAIQTSATARTPDQQNAVDWIAAVEQRQAEQAAQDAGLEYVKWAGLSQGTYQGLLLANASQSDLQTFLCGGDCTAWQASVENYNNPTPSLATGGYCVYRSPAPDSSAYTGYTDPTCFAPCTNVLGCQPPTPSYDQFTKWGEDDATNALLSSSQSVQESGLIATGLIFGASAVGVGVSGVALSSGLAEALVGTPLQEAIFPYAAALEEDVAEEIGTEVAAEVGTEVASSVIAASAGTVAGIVLAAITTAVIEGINVSNAAALPGKLATLIASARTTAPDPATLLNDANGATSLYSLFVGATLPLPLNETCDNSSPLLPGATASGDISEFPPLYLSGQGECLNPTAIPSASSADPRFLVQAKGATTQTSASTITWVDTASQITTTARLSGNWFIDQVNGSTAAAQTLSIAYTDWNGNEQVAWLLGNPTAGYQFVGYNVTAGSSMAIDPATCRANGICWSSPAIDYVGSDGADYSASVQGPVSPTGAPTYSSMVQGSPVISTAVEGSPVTFNANTFAPGAATPPIAYTWEFQQAGDTSNCGYGGFRPGYNDFDGPCEKIDPTTLTVVPDYSAPVSGATASYTWPTTGQYLVRLTATDALGNQAVDTFSVNVADVPPTLALTPACPLASPCLTQTGNVGTAMTLGGTITNAGTLNSDEVFVDWGDGTRPYGLAVADPGRIYNPTTFIDPLALSASADNTSVTFSDTHTYATGGTYHATVSVYDQDGGFDSKTAIETITNPAPTTSGLAPASAPIGSSPTLTVTGSGFVPSSGFMPGSTVQWNGTPLTTTYISPTQVTAQLPATATASTTAGTITVANPAPGGGTSGPQVLYIVPAQSSVVATSLGTSTSASGSATAQIFGGYPTVFGLAAAASGAGTVALAQYSSDPLATAPPSAVNAYFDIFVPAGSSFSTMQVTDCKLNGGSVVYAYDDTTQQWVPVSGQSYNATSGCVSFTLNAGSTPSLSQLSGTVFGVQAAPPTVTVPGPQSVQYGSQVSIPVSATASVATDKLTLHASGLPAGLSLTDHGDGTGTISGTVTAPVGVYTATVTANDGYSDSAPVTVPVTISPAPLSITAISQTMLLHGAVPALTASYSGFVNGETASALTTAPTCTTTATSSSPVGSYPITCAGAVDPNYAISYVVGTLSVLYKWSGFSQPINDPAAGASTMSVFKAGSTVAVKFQLKDATGALVQAGSLPTFAVSAPQACAPGAVDESTSTTGGDTGTTYRWDNSGQQYIYNYGTAKALAGQCQFIRATLDDGTTQSVYVGFK